jgi:predicted nucleic acid-binding protein
VHLAEELDVPLVTSDGKVLRAFPRTALSMEDFTRRSR